MAPMRAAAIGAGAGFGHFHHGFHRRVFFVGDGSYAYYDDYPYYYDDSYYAGDTGCYIVRQRADPARLAGSSRPSLRMNIAQRKGPPVHARRVFLVGVAHFPARTRIGSAAFSRRLQNTATNRWRKSLPEHVERLSNLVGIFHGDHCACG
jgi:hypothetical protein